MATANTTVNFQPESGYSVIAVSTSTASTDIKDWSYGLANLNSGDLLIVRDADASFVTHNADGTSNVTADGISQIYTWDSADGSITSISKVYQGQTAVDVVTETSATFGDTLNINTVMTDANGGIITDGDVSVALTNFSGSNGTYTATIPAIQTSSTGLNPLKTWMVVISNGSASETDIVNAVPLAGYSQIVAGDQASGLIKGDWGFVDGTNGLDEPVSPNDVLWTNASTLNITDTADGVSSAESGTYTDGIVTRYLYDTQSNYWSTLTTDYGAITVITRHVTGTGTISVSINGTAVQALVDRG